jgi:hypothetical protein
LGRSGEFDQSLESGELLVKTGRVDEAHLELGRRSSQVETKRGARRKVLEFDGIEVAVKFVEDAEDDYVGLEVARYPSKVAS